MKRDKLGQYLIGSYTARLDKSGRIKIPEKFRAAIEDLLDLASLVRNPASQRFPRHPDDPPHHIDVRRVSTEGLPTVPADGDRVDVGAQRVDQPPARPGRGRRRGCRRGRRGRTRFRGAADQVWSLPPDVVPVPAPGPARIVGAEPRRHARRQAAGYACLAVPVLSFFIAKKKEPKKLVLGKRLEQHQNQLLVWFYLNQS